MTHATDDEQRPPLGTSRARVLAGLRAAAGDLGAVELAERVALHPNSVRYHLDALHRAGLVERRSRVTGHRGRPQLRYRAVAGPSADGPLYCASVAEAFERGRPGEWVADGPAEREARRVVALDDQDGAQNAAQSECPGGCSRSFRDTALEDRGKPAHPLFAEPAWRTTLACPSVRACGPCADDRQAQVSWT